MAKRAKLITVLSAAVVIATILWSLIVAEANASAVTARPKPAVTPISNRNGAADAAVLRRLETVDREIAQIQQRLIKPPKDAWDKLTAVSTIVSGLIVALIGFYATNVYNRRQREAEDNRKTQELTVSQVQTVEKFIPHLSSENERVRSAALISIAALGNEELAIKLARTFGGSGSTIALANIATTASADVVLSASRALGDLFEYLKARVVTVQDGVKRVGSGFVVSDKGLVVTTAHVVARVGTGPLAIGLPSGVLSPAQILTSDETRDLALLSIAARTSLPTIGLRSSNSSLGARVIGLFVATDGKWETTVGRIEVLDLDLTMHGENGLRNVKGAIGARLRVKTGSSGTPVLDERGDLVGIVQGGDADDFAVLIPTAVVLDFLSKNGVAT